jgi:hypothetical protein
MQMLERVQMHKRSRDDRQELPTFAQHACRIQAISSWLFANVLFTVSTCALGVEKSAAMHACKHVREEHQHGPTFDAAT